MYVNLKESELSHDCLKRGYLRGELKTLCSTSNWQFTLFDLCYQSMKSWSNKNPGNTQCRIKIA
jgi:hypothetical protein